MGKERKKNRVRNEGERENRAYAPLVLESTCRFILRSKIELSRKRQVQIANQYSPTEAIENSSRKCKNVNIYVYDQA